MRNAYLSALHELAGKNKNIYALISDNGAIVYDKYRQDFPEQYINCGISEANMISVAAGMSSCGKIPFAYTIGNFLIYRAFEQIRNDVCLQRMNVKLVGIGVGFVYSTLGPTHHSTEDIALMRTLPGMTIFSPCDPLETKKITYAAAQIDGPVYIRLATGGTPKIYENDYDFQVGKGVILREGHDLTMISTGSIVYDVVQAADKLKSQGISARVVNLPTIKPIDSAMILQAAEETKNILTVEEQNLNGGVGSAVAEVLADHQMAPQFKRLGLQDSFSQGYGSYQDLKELNNLSQEHMIKAAKELLEK